MRHNDESPKSILPHELRTTQIYMLDTILTVYKTKTSL
jgi:hypothetical protein